MSKSVKSAPPTPASRSLSIGALSRATRIPVETLRTWERRYGSPMPVRKPSGHRVYPAGAVEHLRRIGRLLEQGHRPAEILALSVRELDALLSLAPPTAPLVSPPPQPTGSRATGPTLRPLSEMLDATAELDREALLSAFRTGWARLGPLRFLEEIAGPFLVEVGRAWQSKTLEVRHEHFASACLSDFLRGVREPFDARARGPVVVAATLPGEQHDGGLLIASVLMALHGRRVVYLGTNTPVEQIVAAAKTRRAEAVSISVSAATTRSSAARAIGALRDALPRRVALWVGGAGAPAPITGVERIETLSGFDRRLASAA